MVIRIATLFVLCIYVIVVSLVPYAVYTETYQGYDISLFFKFLDEVRETRLRNIATKFKSHRTEAIRNISGKCSVDGLLRMIQNIMGVKDQDKKEAFRYLNLDFKFRAIDFNEIEQLPLMARSQLKSELRYLHTSPRLTMAIHLPTSTMLVNYNKLSDRLTEDDLRVIRNKAFYVVKSYFDFLLSVSLKLVNKYNTACLGQDKREFYDTVAVTQ